MIGWGVKVNDYGNAQLDENGNFIKVENAGVPEDIWTKMTEYADSKGLKKGDYKKINLPFENMLLAQSREVRERMSDAIADFVYDMLVNVFNCKDTAEIAVHDIIATGSYDPGPKAGRIENPDEWTKEKIREKGGKIQSDKGPAGNFED